MDNGNKRFEQEMCYDIDFNRHYILRNGVNLACDSMGNLKKQFTPYGTGHFDHNERQYFSKKVGSVNISPKRPTCLAELKAFYRASLSKFNGYSQFPRPLSLAFCNEKKPKLQKKFIEDIKLVKLESKQNIEALKIIKVPKSTCNFFNKETFMFTSFNKNEKKLKPIRPNSNLSLPGEIIDQETKKALPQKDLLFNSTIKSSYISNLPETFSPMRNLKGLSQESCKSISNFRILNEEESETTENPKMQFFDFKSELKRQQRDLEGYKPPIVKISRVPSKGIYHVSPPTEGELYQTSLDWRKNVNPGSFEALKMREKTDYKLLEKKRNQKIINLNWLNKSKQTSKEEDSSLNIDKGKSRKRNARSQMSVYHKI